MSMRERLSVLNVFGVYLRVALAQYGKARLTYRYCSLCFDLTNMSVLGVSPV
jgi:hypothetical protein